MANATSKWSWTVKDARWPDGTPRMPVSRCPHCGRKLDAASTLAAAHAPQPQPDDLVVCFGCGEALKFDRRLRLVRVSAAELAALEPDVAAEFMQTQSVVRAFLASDYGQRRGTRR
jgi:hypothetical protein